jgi:DNA-binding LytR/AlgR family response regulator
LASATFWGIRIRTREATINTQTAVIAEDEPVLRAELRDTLAALWPDLTVCAEAENGIQALHALHAHAPQVLFLDIEMPGMSGLDVARQASGRCHVVFVTAFDKYAVAAFDQGAVDYVVKPFSPARLATAIDRLRQRIGGPPASLDALLESLAGIAQRNREYLRWVTVTEGSEVRLITVEEVCYFQSDNKYTLVVTADRETLIRRPIRELEAELDPRVFWQIHRGTLVNVNAIAGLTRDIGGHTCVRLKQRRETLRVSEPYMHRFRQA